jgi:hypothetical protein
VAHPNSALPLAGKPSLIRWTRRIINVLLWICGVMSVPMFIGTLGLIATALLAPADHPQMWDDWFTQGVFRPRVMMALYSASFMATLLIAIPLLRELRRIVDSAMTGDPFVPENARRLRRIGWLLLVMTLLIEAGEWISEGISIPMGGLVTVLLVFVLAQIFDKGSHMRAELQETI